MSFKHFITFCAGKPNYYEAGNRLVKQATNLNLFDEISCYTEEKLKSDSEFWEKHSNFIENNPRGYGYWLWKLDMSTGILKLSILTFSNKVYSKNINFISICEMRLIVLLK